jgi:hypothetical protein
MANACLTRSVRFAIVHRCARQDRSDARIRELSGACSSPYGHDQPQSSPVHIDLVAVTT